MAPTLDVLVLFLLILREYKSSQSLDVFFVSIYVFKLLSVSYWLFLSVAQFYLFLYGRAPGMLPFLYKIVLKTAERLHSWKLFLDPLLSFLELQIVLCAPLKFLWLPLLLVDARILLPVNPEKGQRVVNPDTNGYLFPLLRSEMVRQSLTLFLHFVLSLPVWLLTWS